MIFLVTVFGAPRHIDLLVVGLCRDGDHIDRLIKISHRYRRNNDRRAADDAQTPTENALAFLGTARVRRSALEMAA
jgi:hypothetical protein